MFNITMEQYKNQLINITNNCNLPIGAAYYVFKDVLRELENTYYDSLKNAPQQTSEIEPIDNIEYGDDIKIDQSKLEVKEEE